MTDPSLPSQGPLRSCEELVARRSHATSSLGRDGHPEATFGHGPLNKETPPQARHVALPRDAEANGSAVVEVWAAAEPPAGTLRGRATQRVPWQERSGPCEKNPV